MSPTHLIIYLCLLAACLLAIGCSLPAREYPDLELRERQFKAENPGAHAGVI